MTQAAAWREGVRMREWEPGTVALEWAAGPPPSADRDALEALVRRSLDVDLRRLRRPSDLYFHSVFLGGGMEGPSISVDGMADDRGFLLTYHEQTMWMSLSDMDE